MINKKLKDKWITFFRFGKPKEYPSMDYKTDYWFFRFYRDIDDRATSDIVGVLFDKKKYPSIDKIPKEIKVSIKVNTKNIEDKT